MKNIVLTILCFVFLSGCSAFRQIGDDYLKGDEMGEGAVGQAFDSLKYDYLNVQRPVLNERRKTQIVQIAKTALLASPMKNDYSLTDYEIDEGIRMPETFPYIFIHFLPNKDKPDITHTTYLVVIGRQSDRVLYQDVFVQPSGDPFYRYYGVLQQVQR